MFNYLLNAAENMILENRQTKRKQEVVEIKELMHPSIQYDKKAKAID